MGDTEQVEPNDAKVVEKGLNKVQVIQSEVDNTESIDKNDIEYGDMDSTKEDNNNNNNNGIIDDFDDSDVSLCLRRSSSKQQQQRRQQQLVKQSECAICLDSYQCNDIVIWSNNINCSHCFHKQCIKDYLITKTMNINNKTLIIQTNNNDDDEEENDNNSRNRKYQLPPLPPCPTCRQTFLIINEDDDDDTNNTEKPQQHENSKVDDKRWHSP